MVGQTCVDLQLQPPDRNCCKLYLLKWTHCTFQYLQDKKFHVNMNHLISKTIWAMCELQWNFNSRHVFIGIWIPCCSALNDHTVSSQVPFSCQKRLHHFLATSWKQAHLSKPVRPSIHKILKPTWFVARHDQGPGHKYFAARLRLAAIISRGTCTDNDKRKFVNIYKYNYLVLLQIQILWNLMLYSLENERWPQCRKVYDFKTFNILAKPYVKMKDVCIFYVWSGSNVRTSFTIFVKLSVTAQYKG